MSLMGFDYQSFFNEYPDAVLLKVGDQHYPSHMREAASFAARQQGVELEEVTAATALAGKKGKKATTITADGTE